MESHLLKSQDLQRSIIDAWGATGRSKPSLRGIKIKSKQEKDA